MNAPHESKSECGPKAPLARKLNLSGAHLMHHRLHPKRQAGTARLTYGKPVDENDGE